MSDAPLAPSSPAPVVDDKTQAKAEAKAALGWTHTARFLTTAAELKHLPQSNLPEIAFVGRSNAGKSTAINTLAQTRRLAYASKTPGRTQHINLFELGPRDAPDAHWADLPGYGYAAVPKAAKLRWQRVMAHYLDVRRNLAGVVMMVDSRLGFTEIDRNLLQYVAPRVSTGEVKLLVLLTKADKLSRAEGARALDTAQAVLGEIATEAADLGMTLFSALNKTGLEDVAVTLRQWVQDAPKIDMPDVPPLEDDEFGDEAADADDESAEGGAA